MREITPFYTEIAADVCRSLGIILRYQNFKLIQQYDRQVNTFDWPLISNWFMGVPIGNLTKTRGRKHKRGSW